MHNIVLFIVSMIIMIMGIFYTRLISILFWNHAAFAVLSIVMLGISVSGLMVYLSPRVFSAERVHKWIAWLIPLFAASILLSYWGVLNAPREYTVQNWVSIWYLLPMITWATIPFVVGGLIVSLILTHGRQNISKLYFYDMCGAALGALISIGLIYFFNGHRLLFALGAVLSGMGIILSLYQKTKQPLIFSIIVYFMILGGWLNQDLNNAFTIQHAKGIYLGDALHTRWDPAGMVSIVDRFEYSPKDIPQYNVRIDSGVRTPIIGFSGDLKEVEFFRESVLQLGYYLGPFSKTVIVGSGGGSDVLAALVFGNKDITAVEINRSIVSLMQNELAAVSGNVYNRPEVKKEVMDGRAYLAKLDEKVDFIQLVLVDTYNTGAAGSQALSEHFLYTTDAIHDYLDHLTPGGMISMSRFAGPFLGYSETYRLVSLAERALRERGIDNPSEHIIVTQGVRHKSNGFYLGYQSSKGMHNVAAVLISKTPFSENQKSVLKKAIDDNKFRSLWFPGGSYNNRLIQALFDAQGSDGFYEYAYEKYGLDISPISDDRPFFFQQVRPIDFPEFSEKFPWQTKREYLEKYLGAYFIWQTLAALSVLTTVLIALPLALRVRDVRPVTKTFPILLYFIGIGLGYMGIEMGLIHMFAVFLEHPIYSLIVAIATLLLASGVGSFVTDRMPSHNKQVALKTGAGLLALLVAYPLIVPHLVSAMIGLPFILKCIIAFAVIFPLGMVMGMMFPLGVKNLPEEHASLMPWLWGVNTGFSVFATVILMFIATNSGFNAAWIFFTLAYALTLVSLLLTRRPASA